MTTKDWVQHGLWLLVIVAVFATVWRLTDNGRYGTCLDKCSQKTYGFTASSHVFDLCAAACK